MYDPWNTHVLPIALSDTLRPLLKFPDVCHTTTHASASGKIFSVGEDWEVYSILLSDLTVSHMKMESARPQDQKPPSWLFKSPLLTADEKFLVLLSGDFQRLYKFDLQSRRWIITQLNGPCRKARSCPTMAICFSKLCLFPGFGDLDDLWELNISTGMLDQPTTWENVRLATAAGTAPPASSRVRAVTTGQKLFIYETRGVWEFDFRAKGWTRAHTAAGPSKHSDHLFLVDGIIFTLCVYRSGESILAALETRDTPDQSGQSCGLLKLRGFHHSNLGDHDYFIASDASRTYVFLDIAPKEGVPITIRVLDTGGIIDRSIRPRWWDTQLPPEPAASYLPPTSPRPNPGVLDSGSLSDGLSLVKASINDGEICLFDIPGMPVEEGGYCDIFIGTFRPNGVKLALKRARLWVLKEDDTRRRVRREVEIWTNFDHENILPFLGMMSIGAHTYLASPWMEQGDLSSFSTGRVQYLKEERGNVSQHPKHELYHTFNEGQTLQGVASGIAYLHSKAFVHGDLKGKNVLLGGHNNPLLCDFGMTKALDSASAKTSTAMKGAGTLRWQSPELAEDESKTFKSDVYAFAMLIVEVLSGSTPLHELSDVAFMNKVINLNERPPLEPPSRCGIDFAPLWNIATSCWVREPKDRPSIDEVLEQLKVANITERGRKRLLSIGPADGSDDRVQKHSRSI